MDDREIERFLEARGVADHVRTLGRTGLISRWTKFIDQVEQGYPLGLDDYRNDLDIREIIRIVGLDKDVADADRKFQRLLTATHTRVWRGNTDNDFWNLGYPQNASGELLRDLREAKLV